uniref:Uncharacterized protein n=1 Tax=Oryza meridionalis TaxID=40149 RepID=A0A0E0CLN8_9ORYZ
MDRYDYAIKENVEVEVIGIVLLTIVVVGDEDVAAAESLLLAAARDVVVAVVDVVPLILRKPFLHHAAGWKSTKTSHGEGLVAPVLALEPDPTPRCKYRLYVEIEENEK